MGAFDEDGRQIGIVFDKATPFDTLRLMDELVTWVVDERNNAQLHPLLVTTERMGRTRRAAPAHQLARRGKSQCNDPLVFRVPGARDQPTLREHGDGPADPALVDREHAREPRERDQPLARQDSPLRHDRTDLRNQIAAVRKASLLETDIRPPHYVVPTLDRRG